MSRPRPAAFLDRDGVLNHDRGYVWNSKSFEWIDGAVETVRLLNERGFLVLVVTNQAGVARGLYTERDVERLHRWMDRELGRWRARVDAYYFCPHHPTAGGGPYTRPCDCRKPAPGLLLRAMSEWPVDAALSFLVGDHERDLAAAAAAGVPGHLFAGGDLLRFVVGILERQDRVTGGGS